MTGKFAALSFALAASTMSVAGPAMAEAPLPQNRIAEDPAGLADLVLPYTPYLFDFAVTSMRSVAEITYNGRRYDPITRSLVVTGLEVDRDGVHFRIGQMRVATDQMILDDVAVDTSGLPLDPTTREVLDRLGRKIVVGSVTVGLDLDAPRADYIVEATARLDGIGAFDLDADLRGFHFLAPLDRIEGEAGGGRPEIRGRLASADLAFTDMGVVPALYEVLGRQQGLSPQAARSAAAVIAGAAIAGMFADLPGGSTPALQQKTRDWSAAIQAFLKNPGRLQVAFRPDEPFDLSRLTDRVVDARDVEDLDAEVFDGQAVTQALLSPQALVLAPDAPLADVMALAETLLKGRGTPQNGGRALDLIMPAAMDGNRTAVALLAEAIAMNPYVTIAQEKLAPTYVSLDLALAEGLPFAAESLDAIGRRLSPAEIVGAEDEAVSTWRQTPVGQRQRAAEIEAFRTRDWATIRRLAYAYYEGAEMPRNIMRAYGWASIAAAGGDAVAARLRDELTRAAGSGKLVLPLDRARKATDDLWALILGGDEPARPAGTSTPAVGGASEESTTVPPAAGAPAGGAGTGGGASAGGAGSGDPSDAAGDRRPGGAGPSREGSGRPGGPNGESDDPAASAPPRAGGASPVPADPGGSATTPAPQPPRAEDSSSKAGDGIEPPEQPEGDDGERETAQAGRISMSSR
ncbi:hypothetical protein [Jiella avicenniae]|uniref:Uncharacterized protein n=1 Tax=Jiella avicenniae TaxID=2907202 RepID=A0A9X1P126_9HYPH|nr:hypothetical protein [Jiella avicenniae]MCE7027899.1 hypothetical protein [Jiella avicenniae]